MWNVHVPFVRQGTPVSSQSPQHAYKVICRLQRSPCGKYNLPENEKKNQVGCVLSSLREASEQVIVMNADYKYLPVFKSFVGLVK